MGSRVCMNGLCGASSSIEWKKGWPLKSGEFATLCDKCGSAYEQLVFCEVFHSKDTGWRECTSCGKLLHCGCIASSSLLELLDSGGVNCIKCGKSSQLHSSSTHGKPKGCAISTDNTLSELVNKTQFTHYGKADDGGQQQFLPFVNDDEKGSLKPMRLEKVLPTSGDVGNTLLLKFSQAYSGSAEDAKLDRCKGSMVAEDTDGSQVQTNLSIAFSAPSGSSRPLPGAVEGRELSTTISSFAPGSRSRHLLPKPPKFLPPGVETNSSSVPQIRVARPPVEGRVKNQLLPRYWPRITDQELQQISGDSNSTIVPLFEKVLSASDAGRIGRLVLPKACAEAYFPPISQPEGLPLRIQDVKGKEWVFQFRFWPNNNSRMYVLEGVTPCIQSMQLQAGDTVTFSRMDPEGKLLMGFRKATNTIPTLPVKGSRDFPLTASSTHFNGGDFRWHITENTGGNKDDGSLAPSMLVPDRRRSRNIGSKSKRLLVDSQDALELKLTWEEAHEMLRPPPGAKPSTVTIDDNEFEEYEEPPVFGKVSIFTIRLSGEPEQWAQCDGCFRWRRLPADYLLPPKWTCQDNIWDNSRCSCSAPDELSPMAIEYLLSMNKDLRRQRTETIEKPSEAYKSTDMDDSAKDPALRGDASEPGASTVATTTRHPRHRPGCSCIVCIQPPSGKGKHKPTCTCNVCMTVKRRFKTLMMRKKKRQSEREAEIAQRNQLTWLPKEEAEVDSISRQSVSQFDTVQEESRPGNELQLAGQNSNQPPESAEIDDGHLDLNSHPDHVGSHVGSSRVSMTTLVQEATLPLETYLTQNGLASLVSEQQASSGHLLPNATGEGESQHSQHNQDDPLDSAMQMQEDEEELSEPDQGINDDSS